MMMMVVADAASLIVNFSQCWHETGTFFQYDTYQLVGI
jgi:hypothetical protein